MTQYIALIHKEPTSDYGVSFPDFPGCVSAGVTLDEARAMASEALALHIEGMVEDSEALPAPSSLEEIMSDARNREAVAVLVDAPAEAERSIRVNVTLPQSVLARIDLFAQQSGYSRSGFLAKAAVHELERQSKAGGNR